MASYQRIIYPIRRMDGEIAVGEAGPLPTDPDFLGMTVSGQTLSINGVSYSWPLTLGGIDTYLSTDGLTNLSWVSVPGIGFLSKVQDLDTDTIFNVDLLGTGADNTIRLTASGTEIQTITEQESEIKNRVDMHEKFTYNTIATATGIRFFNGIFVHNIIYNTTLANTGLAIYDITNESNVSNISNIVVWGSSAGLAITHHYGNYILHSSTNTGNNFSILDTTDPANPVIANTIACTLIRHHMTMGTFIYLLCNENPNDFEIYDISDPLNEVLMVSSTLATEFERNGMIYKDEILYVSTIDTGGSTDSYIRSYDVSDFTNPIELDTLLLDTLSTIRFEGMNIIGNYLYMYKDRLFPGTAVPGGLLVIDITDPSNLTIADTNYAYNVGSSGGNGVLIVKGKYAYGLERSTLNRIHIYNIEDPNNTVASSNVVPPVITVSISNYRNFLVFITNANEHQYVDFIRGFIIKAEIGIAHSTQLDVDGDVSVSKNAEIDGHVLGCAGINIGGDFTTTDDLEIVSSSIITNGTQNYPVRTSSLAPTDIDEDYGINAQNSIVTSYNLPPIDSTRSGTKIIINKVTTNDITLTADGADLIWDGVSDATTKTLTSVNPNEITEVFCNGVKWFIV